MAKIAFILLCHKDPEGIIRQAERLTAVGDCMAIHFDARAGAEGLPWCFGENELGFQFYDASARFAHRAIKRGGWADRAELWTNALAGVDGVRRRITLGTPVINTTCRPYHLGWVMEAWAGREANIELLGGDR